MRAGFAFLVLGMVLSSVSACGDKALVDPLAGQQAAQSGGDGGSDVGAVAEGGEGGEATTPVTLSTSYSLEREVENDACNLQSTEGARSRWTLFVDQDGAIVNARLETEAGDKILLHGTVGSSEFTLSGSDVVEEGECVKTLSIGLEGDGNETRIRGTLQVAYTYGDDCGVASGQNCTIKESFDSQ